MKYLRNRVVKLEQDLKAAQREIERLHSRPALATERESYVLGEMELANRQLECEYESCFICKYHHFGCSSSTLCAAGFVPDLQAEEERVEERLNNVDQNPTTGRGHFWLDKYHAKKLATLKDRVWRNALLLESCRTAFIQINQALFPTGPQPQGIHALVDIFRQSTSLREAVTQKLVLGANAVMAYVRGRKPNLVLPTPAARVVLAQKDLDGTKASAELLVDRCQEQLLGPALFVKDELV